MSSRPATSSATQPKDDFPVIHPVVMPRQRWERPLLVAILLLAAALRLGAPGITEFKRDEANLSQLALDLAQGRDLPLLAIASSVGVPNPPINVYLMAIPYTLGSSPIPASAWCCSTSCCSAATTRWWKRLRPRAMCSTTSRTPLC